MLKEPSTRGFSQASMLEGEVQFGIVRVPPTANSSICLCLSEGFKEPSRCPPLPSVKYKLSCPSCSTGFQAAKQREEANGQDVQNFLTSGDSQPIAAKNEDASPANITMSRSVWCIEVFSIIGLILTASCEAGSIGGVVC